jgi:hypothetical protein
MAKGDSLFARLEVEFYKDPAFQQLDCYSKLLYLWLWVKCVEERRETIERYQDITYKRLLNFPNRVSIEVCLKNLETFTRQSKHILKYSIASITLFGVARKHPKLFNKLPLYGGDMGEENTQTRQDKSKTITQSPKGTAVDDQFDQFLAAYPKTKQGRTSRTETKRKWDANIKSGVLPEIMILGADNFRISNPDPQYVPGAQVFIGPQRKYLEWQVLHDDPKPQLTKQGMKNVSLLDGLKDE